MNPARSSIVVTVALLAVSISLARDHNRSTEEKNAGIYAELGKAPQKARDRVSPLENDPEAVAAGRLLFEDHCMECHGESAEGGNGKSGRKGPNLRAPQVQNATPGSLFWLLTNGVVRKGMPVWSKLPEPQRWQLISFIQSLEPGEATENKAAAKP